METFSYDNSRWKERENTREKWYEGRGKRENDREKTNPELGVELAFVC